MQSPIFPSATQAPGMYSQQPREYIALPPPNSLSLSFAKFLLPALAAPISSRAREDNAHPPSHGCSREGSSIERTRKDTRGRERRFFYRKSRLSLTKQPTSVTRGVRESDLVMRRHVRAGFVVVTSHDGVELVEKANLVAEQFRS